MQKILFSMFLMATASNVVSEERPHITNERFSEEIEGIEPMLWKDFALIQKNMVACYSEMPSNPETCKPLFDQHGDALYSALRYALAINMLTEPSEPKFCHAFAPEAPEDEVRGYAVTVALLDAYDRTRESSNVYGSELPNTYLAKIIHDSLLESYPCAQYPK